AVRDEQLAAPDGDGFRLLGPCDRRSGSEHPRVPAPLRPIAEHPTILRFGKGRPRRVGHVDDEIPAGHEIPPLSSMVMLLDPVDAISPRRRTRWAVSAELTASSIARS